MVEVHEGAKNHIPDSLWESVAVGRVVASARSTDAGYRRRPARWTRLSASNGLRSRSSPPDEDRGRSSPCNRRRHRPARRSPPAPAARSRPSAPGYSPPFHGPPVAHGGGIRLLRRPSNATAMSTFTCAHTLSHISLPSECKTHTHSTLHSTKSSLKLNQNNGHIIVPHAQLRQGRWQSGRKERLTACSQTPSHS